MKKLLALFLSLTLCLSVLPVNTYAANATNGVAKNKGKFDISQAKKSNDKDEVYQEGQAIVLMNNESATGKSGSLSIKSIQNELPSGVKIEDKIEFSGTSESQTASLKSSGTKGARAVASDDFTVVSVSSEKYSTKKLVNILNNIDSVQYAEPNYRYDYLGQPNDSYIDYQWHLENNGNNNGASEKDIKAKTNEWKVIEGSSNTVIAIMDSGVDISHPDLMDNLWTNSNTNKLKGKHGYNFVDSNTDLSDDVGHGTHVAGIIGAKGNNSEGISGVNQNVSMMILKVGDDFGIFLYDVLRAYEYIQRAQELGVNVSATNLSFGTEEADSSDIFISVLEAVGAKGCISVCAAGNESNDNDGDIQTYPASLDSPYILSVASTDEKGSLSSFSNYGKDSVDLAAPGSSILSTVSYDNYLPSVYDNDENDRLSQTYYSFDDDSITTGGIGQADSEDGEWLDTTKAGLSIVDDSEFFGPGSEDTCSLKWNITDAKEGELFNLFIPYTAFKSTEPMYAGYMVNIKNAPFDDDYYSGVLIMTDTKLNSEGGLPNKYSSIDNIFNFAEYGFWVDGQADYWASFYCPLKNKSTSDGDQRGIVLSYYASVAGNHEIYLDDFGISNDNISSDNFGKYDIYSGTSMSTPMVTGAIGLLDTINSNVTAKQKVANVKGLTENLTDGGDKIDNGTLSLENIEKIKQAYIDDLKVNSDKSVTISGEGFRDGKGSTISANGTPLKTSGWSDKSIVIDKSESGKLLNKIISLEIEIEGKIIKGKFYLVQNKKNFAKYNELDYMAGGCFVSDGKEPIYLDSEGTVFRERVTYDYDDEDDPSAKPKKVKVWSPVGYIDPKGLFPDAKDSDIQSGEVVLESDAVYLNGKLYVTAELECDFASYYSILSYNLKTNKWARVADRPGAETKGTEDKDFADVKSSTLASYNGKLYFIGGVSDSGDVQKNVRVLNLSTKKWSKGTSLPEGRFLSKAHQVGNNLILVLGGNGGKNVPNTLIYNGKTWKTGAQIQNPLTSLTHKSSSGKSSDSLTYYSAATGLVNGGVVISGLPTDGLGDTFIYNVSSNKYTSTDYQLNKRIGSDEYIGTTVDKKLYVSKVLSYDEDYDDEEFYEDDEYYYYDMDDMETPEIMYATVSSGLLKVTATAKHGKITGKGKYLPGQKVTLKASPKKKYYLNKFVVGGKTVKGKKKTIPYIVKNIKAKATFKKYKTKVTLNKKDVNTKAGKKIKLKAKVKKAAKGVKGVKWKSSNKKYATVSKKGIVKIKKAGAGKTVYITATAKDGSKVKAKCKIKIAKR